MATTTDNKKTTQEDKVTTIYLVTYNVKTPEENRISKNITEVQTVSYTSSPSTFLYGLQSNMFSSSKPFHTILREDGVAVSVRKENIIDIQVQDITEKSLTEGFQVRCPKCNNVTKVNDGKATKSNGNGNITILEYSTDASGPFDASSGYKIICGQCKHQVKTDGRFATASMFAWYIEESERTEDSVLLKPFFIDAKGAECINPVHLVSVNNRRIAEQLLYYKNKEGINNYPIYAYINTPGTKFTSIKFEEYKLVRVQDAVFANKTRVGDDTDYKITSFIFSIDGHENDILVAPEDMLIAVTKYDDSYDVLV